MLSRSHVTSSNVFSYSFHWQAFWQFRTCQLCMLVKFKDTGMKIVVSVNRAKTDNCGICLEALAECSPSNCVQPSEMSGDTLQVLGCGHGYHKRCIDCWTAVKRTCAICQAKADMRIVEYNKASHPLNKYNDEILHFCLSLVNTPTLPFCYFIIC